MSLPSPATIFAAIKRKAEAVQSFGEALRDTVPVTIKSGASYTTRHTAALWRHDPEVPELLGGGLLYKERIIFSIRKTDQPTAFTVGTSVRLTNDDDIAGRAYLIDRITQVTADQIAWKYEARRDPAGDQS